jgi:hypothetical protein
MEWSVALDGAGEPVRLRLGAGREPAGAPPGVRVAALSGGALSTQTLAVVRIPRPGLAPGGAVRLDSALTSQARAWRTEWRGEYQLAP